ncbi:MAG: cobalt-precorrin 5A hydrolase [bacterium]|nr:cobalt-precorrin 5A hydrolase [bacterium]
MKLAIVAFTRNGANAAVKTKEYLVEEGHNVKTYCFHKYAIEELEPFYKLGPLIEELFVSMDGILFISAAGIAVRSIAPYVKSKVNDPAVLVMDESKKFVISLLSGHLGGANELALDIASNLKATPVITTATDVNNKLAIDVWAAKRKLYIKEMELAKEVSARLLNDESVGYRCNVEGNMEWKMALECPRGLTKHDNVQVGVCVTYDELDMPFERTLHLIPKNLVLGIGCRKDKDPAQVERVVRQILGQYHIAKEAIVKLCSIDIKKQEKALLQLAEKWQIPFETFSSQELMQLAGDFTGSSFVQSITGVDNVCERSAVLGSMLETKNNRTEQQIIVRKQAVDGVTVALCKIEGQ